MANGKRLRVPHEDFIWIMPNHRVVQVALPILLRPSSGMVLRHGTDILSHDAVSALQQAGIRFSELSREPVAPSLEEVAGERV